MEFELLLDERAIMDIEEAMEYYKTISENVMHSFYSSLQSSLHAILLNPYFQVRYEEYRCLPLKKFPFMIQYKILNDKQLLVLGVINTYRNPVDYYLK